jgi:hypothetical protein
MMKMLNESDNQSQGLFYIKLGCLLFWAVWFSVAFSANFFDFLNMEKELPLEWHFLSGNYQALATVLNIYHTPHGLLNTLFILDISIQAISAILFFVAVIYFLRAVCVWQTVNLAFGISMALWATFLVMEEVFIAYPFEATHVRLIVFEMICLLALHLLPHRSPPIKNL